MATELKSKRWVLEKELKDLRERMELIEESRLIEERDLAVAALMTAKAALDRVYGIIANG